MQITSFGRTGLTCTTRKHASLRRALRTIRATLAAGGKIDWRGLRDGIFRIETPCSDSTSGFIYRILIERN